MRNFLTLFGTFLLLASACTGEDGFETEIEKAIEVEFKFSNNEIRSNDGQIYFLRPHEIIGTDFEEYAGKIKDVYVNKAEVLISGSNEASLSQAFIRLMDVKLRSLGTDVEILDFFKLTDLPLNDLELILLYDKDSVQSQQVESAIKFIGSKALQSEAFFWDLEGNVENLPADGALIIKVLMTVTVTVELL